MPYWGLTAIGSFLLLTILNPPADPNSLPPSCGCDLFLGALVYWKVLEKQCQDYLSFLLLLLIHILSLIPSFLPYSVLIQHSLEGELKKINNPSHLHRAV